MSIHLVLIAMWISNGAVMNESRSVMPSTAVAMQHFYTQETCEAARARIGNQRGLVTFCVKQ